MPDYSFQQAGAPLALGPAPIATHVSPSWVGPYYASDGRHVWHLNGRPDVQYARGNFLLEGLPQIIGAPHDLWVRRDVLPIPPMFISPEPQQSDYPSYQAWKAAWMTWKAHQNENAAYAAAQFGPWTVVCNAALNARVWTCLYRGVVYPPIQPSQPSWYAQSVGQGGSFQQAGAPLALRPAQTAAHLLQEIHLNPALFPCPPGYVKSPYATGPRCLPLPAPPMPPCPPGYTWTPPYVYDNDTCNEHGYFPGACCPSFKDYGPNIWKDSDLGGLIGSCPIQPFADCVPPNPPTNPPYNPCQPGWNYNAAAKKCCPPGWHYDAYLEQCVKIGSPKGY